MNKRGISAIVATVLVILITVAGVTIVWAAIIPMIKTNLELGTACLNADVLIDAGSGYTCYDAGKKIVAVQVKKGANEVKIPKIEFLLGSNGTSRKVTTSFNLDSNAGKVFYIPVAVDVASVSVAPVVKIENKEKSCDIKSKVKLKECSLDADLIELIVEINTTFSNSGLSGSGTSGYITQWSDSSTLSDSVIFQTNGNVGIGTTGPLSKLDFGTSVANEKIIIGTYMNGVNGTWTGIGMDSANAGIRIAGDPAATTNTLFDVGCYSADASHDWTSRMYITGNGNVGIGTTSPQSLMELYKITSDVNTPANAHLLFQGSTNSAYRWGQRLDTSGNLNFDTNWGASDETKVTFQRSGNVGIGTTTPLAKFEVINGSDAEAFMVSTNSTNAGDLLVVKSDGNVGIGTTEPGEKLEVVGDTLLSGTSAYLRLNRTGYTQWDIGQTVAGLQFYDGTAPRLYLETGGNVGIGTTAPNGKFHVNSTSDIEVARFEDENGNKVVINKDGNVGIGTTSPGGLLHVYKSSSLAPDTLQEVARFETHSTTDFVGGEGGYISLQSSDNGQERDTARISWSNQDSANEAKGTLGFWTGDDAATLKKNMVIKNDGNVGIGTTAPVGKLNVIGLTNSTTGFAVGANTGLTGNYSVGNCFMAYAGGIMYQTNCTAY